VIRHAALVTLLCVVGTRVALTCTDLAPRPTTQEMVAQSDVIVRAVAGDYVPGAAMVDTPLGHGAPIAFAITETIRGQLPGALVVFGELSQVDRFNGATVPYMFGPLKGSLCHPINYRKGTSYLFLLKNRPDGLTPYWHALAPLNEQLKSDTDPWLTWVRQNVAKGK
jgi:hypothetical protein